MDGLLIGQSFFCLGLLFANAVIAVCIDARVGSTRFFCALLDLMSRAML
jgi:hypothetical protein